MPSEKKTTVLLADDHLIIREGLRALLVSIGGYEVVAETADGDQTVEAVKVEKPDVVILDLIMPGQGIKHTIQAIKKSSSRTKIVVLTMHTAFEYVRAALRTGADGYVVKGSGIADLHRALSTVLAGGRFISPAVEGAALKDLVDGPAKQEWSHPLDRLTKREIQVLILVASGHSTKDVAQNLGLSTKTVGWYRERIMATFDLHDVTALTRFAVRHGLLDVNKS